MQRTAIVFLFLFIVGIACDNYSWRPIRPEEYESDDLAGKDFNYFAWNRSEIDFISYKFCSQGSMNPVQVHLALIDRWRPQITGRF